MKGKFYIDGKDAFVAYGLFVANNGYNGLIAFPSFKELDENNWPEQDGTEVDLSSPVLNALEFSINFYSCDYFKTMDFISLISDGSYHEYNFVEAGCTRKLRLVSNPSKKIHRNMETFSLSFSDDFPMEGYEYLKPIFDDGIPPQEDYEIDGKLLSEYGVFVLDGSDAEITKMPSVKKNLLVDIPSQSGVTYDGKEVVFEKKDVALKCWMRCNDVTTMWRNLNSLVYDLITPTSKTDKEGYEYLDAERSLYVESLGEEYPCYFNGLSASKFQLLSNDRVWLEFTLTLTFTSFRVNGVEYLLATEAGELIVTEDGEYYIDLKDYAN